MDNFGNVFALVAILALLNERLIEHLLTPLPFLKPYMLYTGMASGILLAVMTGVDVVSPTFENFGQPLPPSAVARFLTGVLIGGGSQFLHDVWGKFTKKV